MCLSELKSKDLKIINLSSDQIIQNAFLDEVFHKLLVCSSMQLTSTPKQICSKFHTHYFHEYKSIRTMFAMFDTYRLNNVVGLAETIVNRSLLLVSSKLNIHFSCILDCIHSILLYRTID